MHLASRVYARIKTTGFKQAAGADGRANSGGPQTGVEMTDLKSIFEQIDFSERSLSKTWERKQFFLSDRSRKH